MRYEKLLLLINSDQNIQLDYLSENLGIDFPDSHTVPQQHVQEVRSLGHRCADWINSQGHINFGEHGVLNSFVDTYFVLTEKDHRSLGSSIKRRRIQQMKEVCDQLAFYDSFQTRVLIRETNYKISLFEQDLASWETVEHIPPAQVFHLYTPDTGNGEAMVGIIAFTDWSEGDPYSVFPRSSSVGEETLHLASEMSKSETALREFSPRQLITIEEMAVKYYGLQMLEDLGGYEDDCERFRSVVGSHAQVWEEFIERVSKKRAAEFFFRGHTSRWDLKVLLGTIDSAIERGLVE